MPYDRVIRDSDDDDDPLLEECPSRIHPAPAHRSHTPDASYGDMSDDPLHGESSRQIAIDFDEFLISQGAAQAGISSSQQRREERWIPASVGDGSIGTMMTEIGLAQQQLFDGEDAHTSAQSGPRIEDEHDGSKTVENRNGFIDGQNGFQREINIIVDTGAVSLPSIQQLGAQNNGRMDSNPDDYYYQHVISAPVNHSTSLSSHGCAQSGTSYNIFESSLRPCESAYSENNTTLKSYQTISTQTMQKSPRRWSSIQGAPPSPHDTEPNSSILSAKAARSRSDNVNADEILQSLSVDERSLPVAIEIPPVGKKRGRPKKSLPDNDEENELAQPVGNQIVDQPSIPEKRRPGRPPKNQKMAETSVDRISQITHPDDTLPLPKQTDDETLNTAENNASQPPIQHSAPEPKATNISAENHDNKTNPLTNPTKDSKKKKLKRGKTTSVVLKKTYESDVEDDVIWVDERPSPTTLQDVTSAPFSVNIEIANPSPSHANVSDETRQDDENMMNPSNTIQQSEQAPKKRGRKRKKTSDQPQPIAEQPDNPPSYQHEESSHLNTDAHNPFSLDNHTTNIEANNTLPAQITSPEEQNTSSHSESPPKQTSISNAPMTPSKPPPGTPLQSSTDPNPDITTKGPDKHSPISSTSKVPYRVGLSRRARISPLLKIVRR